MKREETGHAVNISNFKLLIDQCDAFGVTYNPSNANLTIANMTTLWTAGDTAHQTLTAAVQAAKAPINARQILFEPTGALVTRTLNYFNSTTASAQIKADAKGLADRYRGYGVGVAKLPDGTPDPADVSTSHKSFVQKADSFKQLVDLYGGDAAYAPNEPELKLVQLTAVASAMKTANGAIGMIIAPVNTLRVERNKALYEKDTGMVDQARDCKNYVKALYGATAPEAKLVTWLRFKRPSA
ncbi:MAG: hypothetical protein IPP83_17145 [Flavobacteriales bacterium]|nr:hypothetical protein [Flavobacteriales bacterium]